MTNNTFSDLATQQSQQTFTETRHVVIFGYSAHEINGLMRHFECQLPDYVKISIDSRNLVTKIRLTGTSNGIELLRFKMNVYQQQLQEIFAQDVVTFDNKSIAEVLGELLMEREQTVASAESCTGGNIAHRIVQVPGSSAYFMGSVVSYSNDVKANVLGVSRADIDNYGAVSKQVVEAMAKGVAELMRSDCAIATSGIAGPDGGSRFKPVGTVWIAVKYGDKVVSECVHFKGNRDEVIESATNHGLVMLINLLKNSYILQEDINDE